MDIIFAQPFVQRNRLQPVTGSVEIRARAKLGPEGQRCCHLPLPFRCVKNGILCCGKNVIVFHPTLVMIGPRVRKTSRNGDGNGEESFKTKVTKDGYYTQAGCLCFMISRFADYIQDKHIPHFVFGTSSII